MRSKTLRNPLKFVFLLGAFCLLFVSCSKTSSKKKYKSTLILDWWANPNHIPIFVAIHNKIFEKYGIDLEVISLNEPPDSLVYLMSNKADVSLYYAPHSVRAFANNCNFKVVGKLIDTSLNSFICRKDSNIETLKDFHGKSFGLFPEGITIAMLDMLTEKHEVRVGELKTIQFDLCTILYTKALDIISGVFWNIEPHQLRDKNVDTRSFKWTELGFPDYPELVFLSSNRFLKEHPGFGVRFRKALEEASLFCLNNPDDAFEMYLECNPDSRSQVSWEKPAWMETLGVIAKNQKFDIKRWQNLYEWMSKNQLLTKDFELKALLEPCASIDQ